MNALGAIDELVKEYLAFRGFSNALRAFEGDVKADRDKGFHVERVVDHLLSHVLASDLPGLTAYWGHLDNRFFSRLDHTFAGSIRKLEISLQVGDSVLVLNGCTEGARSLGTTLRVRPEKTSDVM